MDEEARESILRIADMVSRMNENLATLTTTMLSFQSRLTRLESMASTSSVVPAYSFPSVSDIPNDAARDVIKASIAPITKKQRRTTLALVLLTIVQILGLVSHFVGR